MPFDYRCHQCGEAFVRRGRIASERTFCSRSCYHAATIKYAARSCVGCGVTFTPQGGGLPSRSYCTHACYKRIRSAATVSKKCPVCKESFTVPQSYAHRFTVCSMACKTVATKYVDCKRCGKRFRAEKRLNRHYCSETCRRPPVFFNCGTCGKRKRICPGEAHRQFCSLSCYRKSRGETLLEKRVREALSALGIVFEQEKRVSRWSVDFALTDLNIALEADGNYWHAMSVERDAARDRRLTQLGWRVVRVLESDVNNAVDLGKLLTERLKEVPVA